jgi:hypothetical protein
MVSARKNHSTRGSARKHDIIYSRSQSSWDLDAQIHSHAHTITFIQDLERHCWCPKPHNALCNETEHQTDRKHADAENTQVLERECMKVHTLNIMPLFLKVHTLEKKHKWASKHTPLLLEACTIMTEHTDKSIFFLFYFIFSRKENESPHIKQ